MLTHFSISKQGKSHIAANINCQDYSASAKIINDKLNQEFVVSIISDGVGSCRYSEFGSETAVESCLEYVKQQLENLTNPLDEDQAETMLKQAFELALDKVEQKAEEMNLPFLSFDCTLTCAVYDGSNLYFQHIGDDGIVALFTDGSYRLITGRHKGEKASSVYPLRNRSLWQYGCEKNVVSCCLMTDGILDRFVGSAKMNNRVYYPFLYSGLKFSLNSDEEALQEKQWWDKYLSSEGNDGRVFADEWNVDDDITYAVIQNPQKVNEVKVEPFDEDKWNEDTKKRNEEIKNALYNDFYTYQKQKKQKEEEAVTLVDTLCNMAAESYDLGVRIKSLIRKMFDSCEDKKEASLITLEKENMTTVTDKEEDKEMVAEEEKKKEEEQV